MYNSNHYHGQTYQGRNQTISSAPNPQRFANFTLTNDETGFRIQNCDHIFEFDIYGGW